MYFITIYFTLKKHLIYDLLNKSIVLVREMRFFQQGTLWQATYEWERIYCSKQASDDPTEI